MKNRVLAEQLSTNCQTVALLETSLSIIGVFLSSFVVSPMVAHEESSSNNQVLQMGFFNASLLLVERGNHKKTLCLLELYLGS